VERDATTDVGRGWMATFGIVGLVSAYCRAVLGTTIRAMIVGATMASLYVYLFVLLRLEEFALLVGSIGLFVLLAAVMYLTRWISWPSMGREDDRRQGSE
jgi:inner membrane protein